MNTYPSDSKTEGGKIGFYFAVLYLIAEFMRPQQMYDFLAGFPLAQVAMIGLLISYFIEGRGFNSTFQNILMIGFLLWVFISYLFAFHSEVAWQFTIDFFKIFVMYFLLINTINDRQKLYAFVTILLLIIFKQTQHIVRYLLTPGFQVPKTGMYGNAGFLSNPGDLGTTLITFFGVSYFLIKGDSRKVFGWFKMRWFHIASTAFIILTIFATNSRGPALALAICFFFLWFKGKKKILGIVGIAVAAMVFLLVISGENLDRFKGTGTEEDNTGQQRLELWSAGLRMANENPITGVGPGNFVYVNKRIYNSEYNFVQHNTFVQALSELGYPGLTLFIMIIIGCFYNQMGLRRILRENNIEDSFLYSMSYGIDLGLIGFVVAGFFVSVLYYPFFWILLIMNASLLSIVKNISNIKRVEIK